MSDKETRAEQPKVPPPVANQIVESSRATRVVEDVVPTWDTARFEHMQRIAMSMAATSILPETLTHDGPKDKRVALPDRTVVANCFRIVNQAARWGMDPYAVADCCSIVHGRLCYEGKLVAAVLDQKLGVRLAYAFDEAKGDQLGVVVSGTLPGEDEPRTVEGIVAQWKTTGTNSPWSDPRNWKRQLRYRGAREWARAHAPAVMLGVYTRDEMDELNDRPMRDITPVQALTTTPFIEDIPFDDKPDIRPDAKAAATLTEAIHGKAVAASAEPDKKADITDDVFLDDLDAAYGLAGNLDALNEHMLSHELQVEERGLEQAAANLYAAHQKRIYQRGPSR